MKKILTAICLMLATASAAFAGGNIEKPVKKAVTKTVFSTMQSCNSSQNNNSSCTVTVTGSIGVGSTSVSVSCAATASTCDAATNQAISCVNGAIKKVRALM